MALNIYEDSAGGRNAIVQYTAGEAVSKGDALYKDPDGKLYKQAVATTGDYTPALLSEPAGTAAAVPGGPALAYNRHHDVYVVVAPSNSAIATDINLYKWNGSSFDVAATVQMSASTDLDFVGVVFIPPPFGKEDDELIIAVNWAGVSGSTAYTGIWTLDVSAGVFTSREYISHSNVPANFDSYSSHPLMFSRRTKDNIAELYVSAAYATTTSLGVSRIILIEPESASDGYRVGIDFEGDTGKNSPTNSSHWMPPCPGFDNAPGGVYGVVLCGVTSAYRHGYMIYANHPDHSYGLVIPGSRDSLSPGYGGSNISPFIRVLDTPPYGAYVQLHGDASVGTEICTGRLEAAGDYVAYTGETSYRDETVMVPAGIELLNGAVDPSNGRIHITMYATASDELKASEVTLDWFTGVPSNIRALITAEAGPLCTGHANKDNGYNVVVGKGFVMWGFHDFNSSTNGQRVKYMKIDSNEYTPIQYVGIANADAAADATVDVVQIIPGAEVELDAFSSLTPGIPCYLDWEGDVVQTDQKTGLNIGYAKNATTVILNGEL